ncbi:PAS domain-containing sensor histidine kinase [Pedobacter mucosus]|uniref:PAS domain-containing sensor histidine kinase n=1 Tax=Pedobacter mucosus TaxID=2895286 RepID=UPI001EE48C3C|nr:PAS domain-containing sensor histidine kinase [Pedobacter mucosus]UKT64768.1 PAS domain-containing sensor histidine kinase [Pedobacter mucosus]
MNRSKLLGAIIENAIDGIITIDQRGIIEHLNPAALALFGYEREELVGRNVSVLMPDADSKRHDTYLSRYEQTGEKHIIGVGREIVGKRKDGSVFPFRVGISEIKFSDRKIYTGFIHDLSKEKANEEQIKSYTEKLEIKIKERTHDLIELVSELEMAKENMQALFQKEKELNQLKTRFVSMASHEFRTPLSSIQLSASLIDKYTTKQDTTSVEKHTLKIKNSINNLTTILNDFLSLEKLEAGKVKASAQSFNIISFAEEIAEEMQLMTKQNQHIVYEHTGNTSDVYLDPNLLRNCVINLISNSIKYSGEDTHIKFSTKIKNKELILEVTDNGIGIPHADQHNLFEPFFRANNTGDIAGTGLGLNIVKRYVGLMNGSVSCQSEQHSGTVFTLMFKIEN